MFLTDEALAQIAPAAPAWQAQPGASQPHRINEQRVELRVVALIRPKNGGRINGVIYAAA